MKEKTIDDYRLYENYIIEIEKICSNLEYKVSFEEWLEYTKIFKKIKESNLLDKLYLKRTAEYIGLQMPKRENENQKIQAKEASDFLVETIKEALKETSKKH